MAVTNFFLVDDDHERQGTCQLSVHLDELRVDLDWALSVNEDYLSEGDAGPEPFELGETIVFDDAAALSRFVLHALSDLTRNCYQLFDESGEPLEELDGLATFEAPARPGNVAAHQVSVAALEQAYQAPLHPDVKAFLATQAGALQRREALDLPGKRIDDLWLGCDFPVLVDLQGPSLLTNAETYRRPGLCAFGKFVGQGLGLTYQGVLQADAQGRIVVTTRSPSAQYVVADDIAHLARLLATPGKLARQV